MCCALPLSSPRCRLVCRVPICGCIRGSQCPNVYWTRYVVLFCILLLFFAVSLSRFYRVLFWGCSSALVTVSNAAWQRDGKILRNTALRGGPSPAGGGGGGGGGRWQVLFSVVCVSCVTTYANLVVFALSLRCVVACPLCRHAHRQRATAARSRSTESCALHSERSHGRTHRTRNDGGRRRRR